MAEPLDIRSIRQTLGLTQTVLAEKLGVAQGDLSNWELGKHNPSKLARQALEARLADLVSEHATPKPAEEAA